MWKALGKVAILSMLSPNLAADNDTKSPSGYLPKTECDASIPVSIRYSPGNARLHIESADGSTRGGCITLQQIWEHQKGKAPLYAVDPESGDVSHSATGTWLLTKGLVVESGITLKVHGTSAGGDADELRLLSTSDTFINLRAYGGSLDFLSTKVFAWDTSTNSPDKDEQDGRSYISAISEVVTDERQACNGRAKKNTGEARMDIEDSEMAHLGYHGGKTCGLTWQVLGLCADMSSPEVLGEVNAYGNIYNSEIHHNNVGAYTYGHKQGDWSGNKIHHNSGYGLDSRDDSDILTIDDNGVYDNRSHGNIVFKPRNGVSIQGNEVHRGASSPAGTLLHRDSDDSVVKGNYVHDNGDARLVTVESLHTDVSSNVFENDRYGMRLCVECCVGCRRNVLSKNVVSSYGKFNTYSHPAFDAYDVVDSERSPDNELRENSTIENVEGIDLIDADGPQSVDNKYEDATTSRFNDDRKPVRTAIIGLTNSNVEVANGTSVDPISVNSSNQSASGISPTNSGVKPSATRSPPRRRIVYGYHTIVLALVGLFCGCFVCYFSPRVTRSAVVEAPHDGDHLLVDCSRGGIV